MTKNEMKSIVVAVFIVAMLFISIGLGSTITTAVGLEVGEDETSPINLLTVGVGFFCDFAMIAYLWRKDIFS